MDYAFTDYLPFWFAPDPAGIVPAAESATFLVEHIVPVQHSPVTSWSMGTPYPGPAALVHKYVDDSARYWGRMGQGAINWEAGEISPDLPPMLPQDLYQHIDTWQYFAGGYPSIARNRPTAFGDQVPVLDFLRTGQ